MLCESQAASFNPLDDAVGHARHLRIGIRGGVLQSVRALACSLVVQSQRAASPWHRLPREGGHGWGIRIVLLLHQQSKTPLPEPIGSLLHICRIVRENYFQRADHLDIFLSHRHPAMKMRSLDLCLLVLPFIPSRACCLLIAALSCPFHCYFAQVS